MQKPRLFLFVGHAFFGWGFGGLSQGESRCFCVHGTRCRFWHCYGFFYLAVALQHVPNIFNIAPESAPHAPVVASASRRVPRPPLTSERRDPQRPRAVWGHPFPFRTCVSRDTRLLSVPANTPVWESHVARKRHFWLCQKLVNNTSKTDLKLPYVKNLSKTRLGVFPGTLIQEDQRCYSAVLREIDVLYPGPRFIFIHSLDETFCLFSPFFNCNPMQRKPQRRLNQVSELLDDHYRLLSISVRYS